MHGSREQFLDQRRIWVVGIAPGHGHCRIAGPAIEERISAHVDVAQIRSARQQLCRRQTHQPARLQQFLLVQWSQQEWVGYYRTIRVIPDVVTVVSVREDYSGSLLAFARERWVDLPCGLIVGVVRRNIVQEEPVSQPRDPCDDEYGGHQRPGDRGLDARRCSRPPAAVVEGYEPRQIQGKRAEVVQAQLLRQQNEPQERGNPEQDSLRFPLAPQPVRTQQDDEWRDVDQVRVVARHARPASGIVHHLPGRLHFADVIHTGYRD